MGDIADDHIDAMMGYGRWSRGRITNQVYLASQLWQVEYSKHLSKQTARANL